MAQYIDKSAVVAEIRGKINSAEAYLKYHPDDRNRLVYSYKHQILTMCELLSFINTLEVKEVDLEKDIKNAFKAGYELGIQKAQKGGEE